VKIWLGCVWWVGGGTKDKLQGVVEKMGSVRRIQRGSVERSRKKAEERSGTRVWVDIFARLKIV